MNILIVHNMYSQYGGEDKIVQEQVEILGRNNNIHLYSRNNNEIAHFNRLQKIDLLKQSYSSEKTKLDISTIIKNFKPDVAHVHNVYPLISPVVYEVLNDYKIPIIQTLHNYRFLCPNGLLFNKNICERCLESDSYYKCLLNKCYHNSYIQN